MERRVAAIVEGDGEVDSVPLLLRRVHEARPDLRRPKIERRDVLRIPRSKIVRKGGELERAIELASRRVGPDGAVLVLLDADDAVPCAIGPDILERARAAYRTERIAVVIANREYEAWFIASAETLGLGNIEVSRTAESRRDAKGFVKSVRGRYRPVVDQPKLTAAMDLSAARTHAPSFDKLWREVCRLLAND